MNSFLLSTRVRPLVASSANTPTSRSDLDHRRSCAISTHVAALIRDQSIGDPCNKKYGRFARTESPARENPASQTKHKRDSPYDCFSQPAISSNRSSRRTHPASLMLLLISSRKVIAGCCSRTASSVSSSGTKQNAWESSRCSVSTSPIALASAKRAVMCLVHASFLGRSIIIAASIHCRSYPTAYRLDLCR